MEGRRRRAQRLTQDIQAQGEMDRQETEPDDLQEEASGVDQEIRTSDLAGGERIRRRAAQRSEAVHETENKAAKPEHIPRMPQIDADDRTVRVNMPKADAEPENGKAVKRAAHANVMDNDRIRHAASASARAGKEAAKGLGGLILLAVMLVGEGMKKLCVSAGKLVQAAKDVSNKPARREIAQEEYELEMIRPQDYHGRGEQHAKKEAAKAPDVLHRILLAGRKVKKAFLSGGRDRALLLNRLLSVLMVCIALFSAWQIGAIVVRSVRTSRLNESLSQQRAAIIQEHASEDAQTEEALPVMETVSEIQMQLVNEPAHMDEEAQDTQVIQAAATAVPDIVKTTKYRRIGGDALPEMAELYKKNRDLVAWVQIPDVLDLPVVYRDNSYYLTRDFNKQKNASGTIFLDVNHPFKEKTQNLLLHGHNMKDGTMFGRLAQYLYDDTYIRNHPFIYFDTLWHKEQYVIVAVLNVSLKPGDLRFFNYFTHDTFSSDKEFETYIRQLQLRSYYAIPIDVNPSDALLTLSTCLDDDRLVIVARRLRANETRSDLRTLIRMTTKQ